MSSCNREQRARRPLRPILESNLLRLSGTGKNSARHPWAMPFAGMPFQRPVPMNCLDWPCVHPALRRALTAFTGASHQPLSQAPLIVQPTHPRCKGRQPAKGTLGIGGTWKNKSFSIAQQTDDFRNLRMERRPDLQKEKARDEHRSFRFFTMHPASPGRRRRSQIML